MTLAGSASADVAGSLTLEITGSPDPAQTGERITMELLACNSSAVEATGATITMILPVGVSFTVATDGATCTTGSCSTGATLTWNLGTLLANRCRMVRMGPLVTAGTVDDTIIAFNADLEVDGGATVSDTFEVTVKTSPALVVALSDSADPVAAGDSLSYTVAFGNRGTTANILSTVLKATVPAGTTVLAIEDGGTESGGEITWPIGTLGAGVTGRRRFSVTVDEGAVDGTAVVAEAEITGGGAVPARATQATAVVGTEQLSLHIAAAPDAVASANRILYDITACNSGAFDATGVLVDIVLPNGLSFTVATDGASCTTGSCSTGAVATWSLGTLAAARCRTVQASINAAATVDADLIRIAPRLRADGGALASATRTVALDGTQALVLALAEDREPIAPGDEVTYTLTYGSVAASANALAVTLRAWVPPGTTVASISHGGLEADGVITWDLATVRAGESGRRRFTVNVDAGALDGTALDVAAEIDADSGATFGATASQTTTVNSDSPLSLRLTALPDPVRRANSERVYYDAAICNSAGQDATGVVADTLLPNDVSFLVGADGVTCTTGSCSTGARATWSLGTIGAGRCRPLSFSVINGVVADGGQIAIGVRVQADDMQMALALRPVVKDDTPAFGLALVEDRDPVLAGALETYTLTASNRSDVNVADANLVFAVPEGTTVDWISDEGVEADGAVTWALGTMTAGETVRRQVIVMLDQGLADGTSLVAEAEITGGSAEIFGARASQATMVVADEALTIDVTSAPNPVRSGEQASFEITACNHGPLDATGVVYDVRMPNYTSFARANDGATCTTGSCSVGALVTWAIGGIPAGRCRAVAMPTTVTSTADGDLVVIGVRARADGGSFATAVRTVAANDDQPLTTALVEEIDPVAPGAETTYEVWFGNRGATTLSDGDLRVTVPGNATVVDASMGAVVDGSEVSWPLCPLTAGQSGTFSFTVELDDATALGAGDALLSDMQISGTDARGAASQASSTTGVLDQAPVRLSIIPTPAIAKPLDLITYEITACNDSPLQATGVVISVFVPRGTTLISVQDGGVNGVAGELRWNIPSIDAATCSTVSFVARMNSGGSYLGDGTVIFTSARVIVDGGDTATANTAIRACMGDPTTCAVNPPPPCAAPQTRACNRTASDALAVLRTAVALRTCPLCECDVDGSGATTASDALSTLRFSVGQPITLRCPPCL